MKVSGPTIRTWDTKFFQVTLARGRRGTSVGKAGQPRSEQQVLNRELRARPPELKTLSATSTSRQCEQGLVSHPTSLDFSGLLCKIGIIIASFSSCLSIKRVMHVRS